jgi:ABC-type glycerol-3-phosphate transport system permease component
VKPAFSARRRRGWITEAAKIVPLTLLLIVTWIPLLLTISLSLRTQVSISLDYFALPWPPTFANYAAAWEKVGRNVLNSMAVSSVTAVLTLAVASIAAYAFARLRFRGKGLLFSSIITLLLVPYVLTVIPRFVIVRDLGLLGSAWVLVLPYVALTLPLAVFLLQDFFRQLPETLVEAARIDGAGELRIYVSVVLPLSLPITMTVAILNVLDTWNHYIWPLIVLRGNEGLRPVTVAIAYLAGESVLGFDYGLLMASYVLSMIPVLVLFIVAMRSFIHGVTGGALVE